MEGSDAGIPKVNLTPNIEEIKNNAMDLNQTRMSVDSMMVPDSILTDYSSQLPEQNNVDLSSLLDNPKEEPVPTSTNRFFNDLPSTETKKNDDFDINSLFQLDNNFDSKSLDVIDNPMTPKVEEKKEEQKPVIDDNQEYLGPQTNRFFNTSSTEPVIPPTIDTTPKIFDPMSLVPEEKFDTLDQVPTPNEKNIIDNTISSLKQAGLNVELNTTDTLTSTIYTIIIRK